MIEIITYTIIIFVSYWILKAQYRKRQYLGTRDGKNLSWIMVVFLALLWVGFNIVITNLNPNMSGDRLNYVANFNGRQTPSIGLSWIISFVHLVNGDVRAFFYLSTFLCMGITMYAYRINSHITPAVMMLMYLTEYEFLTTSLLKQTFTSAFAVLFFTFLLQEHTKKQSVFLVLLIVLACLFHPCGYILIPMYFVINSPKNWKTITIYIIALIVVALFFQPLLRQLAIIINPIAPSLASKILQYFETAVDDIGGASVIKGLPIYIIAILGIYKRKHLKDCVPNYDNYLIVTLTGAFLYLMSMYNVWVYRFIYLFYFSIFVFYTQIIKRLYLKTNAAILNAVVYTSLAVLQYRFLYLVYVLKL